VTLLLSDFGSSRLPSLHSWLPPIALNMIQPEEHWATPPLSCLCSEVAGTLKSRFQCPLVVHLLRAHLFCTLHISQCRAQGMVWALVHPYVVVTGAVGSGLAKSCPLSNSSSVPVILAISPPRVEEGSGEPKSPQCTQECTHTHTHAHTCTPHTQTTHVCEQYRHTHL
jgi:hypothetical protein